MDAYGRLRTGLLRTLLKVFGKQSLPKSMGGLCLLLASIVLLAGLPSAQAQHYDYNKKCQKAHQALLKRNLHKAEQLLGQVKEQDPDNLIPYYLYHYRDFLQVYMYGEDELFQQVADRVDKRLDKLEQGPESSAFRSFTMAEVHLIWSLLQIRKGNYWSAGLDLYRAYKDYQSTTEKFPDFTPARRVLAAINGMVGTLPDTYQWVIRRFGIDGDLQQSLKAYPDIIDQLATKPKYQAFHKESLIIFSYMQLHLENAPKKAWSTIKQATTDYQSNPLSALLRANMALNMQKAETTLQTLQHFREKEAPIPYINYLVGSALLYNLQPESRHYLKAYVQEFQGGTYIKNAYLKMGWAGLLKGDIKYYTKCKSKLKTEGSTVRSTDKQALEEADHYTVNNRYLLKARLSYDGGYYQQALNILREHSEPTLGEEPALSSLEYHYRLGRIYQALDQQRQALQAYDQVSRLEHGKRKHYYLPGSILQTGLIYEELNRKQKAQKAFEKVLDFGSYPYSKALSQKAKAGLKRLKGDE